MGHFELCRTLLGHRCRSTLHSEWLLPDARSRVRGEPSPLAGLCYVMPKPCDEVPRVAVSTLDRPSFPVVESPAENVGNARNDLKTYQPLEGLPSGGLALSPPLALTAPGSTALETNRIWARLGPAEQAQVNSNADIRRARPKNKSTPKKCPTNERSRLSRAI